MGDAEECFRMQLMDACTVLRIRVTRLKLG
jgi:hypothetical protein